MLWLTCSHNNTHYYVWFHWNIEQSSSVSGRMTRCLSALVGSTYAVWRRLQSPESSYRVRWLTTLLLLYKAPSHCCLPVVLRGDLCCCCSGDWRVAWTSTSNCKGTTVKIWNQLICRWTCLGERFSSVLWCEPFAWKEQMRVLCIAPVCVKLKTMQTTAQIPL